ncbi:hypothetical protein VR7878_02372 [Vibrio ruber DSM 16370]|uniref:Uncharacterized protein n=1 Tax=Vibrio ruber (strain DSM 16370 / JCM 11486 / BCRC 17186 / CECT 7878 / LMG 23124 / VR1) TaxID=1123498 RepID=A0A1R4LLS4_VIBR1|nr:hypothetical protein VR7878_02372 [Vibrio ruber DSM 16370]
MLLNNHDLSRKHRACLRCGYGHGYAYGDEMNTHPLDECSQSLLGQV